MRIGIVGAGFTGLTAALKLVKKDHKVVVFEREKVAGGLATGFKEKSWDWHLEHFFHHLFASDTYAKKLISELSLTEKLFYKRPKTSVFKNGKISQFDSPLSVLTFPHLSLLEKLQVGLVTSYLKATPCPKQFKNTLASKQLPKIYGKHAYQVLWEPLLKAKFGQEAQKISMVWFWARIKKRSAKLGYLEGGFQILVDKLIKKIKEKDGQIFFNHEIKNLNEIIHDFDKIIFTAPASIFLKTAQNLPQDFKAKLEKLKMVGALNLILTLKEKFLRDGTYWLNVNEKGFPFVACVEHTNFVDPKHYGGNHIVYVGGYYPQNHRFFKISKKEILKEFLPSLKKINPSHSLSLVNSSLFTSLYAQPIVPPGYAKTILPHQTPLKNVFLANMQQVYPWDRGINYAIESGERVAKLLL